MRNLRIIICAILLLLFVTFPVFAAHISVEIKTKDGEKIDPIKGQNIDEPYSTKATCGSCHRYSQIEKGNHFYEGWDLMGEELNLQRELDTSDEKEELTGEIDCLICHMADYNFDKHIELSSRGDPWAATVAAGLAQEAISGGGYSYDTSKFNSNGNAEIDIGSTTTNNCLNCHGPKGMSKTGFSWNDKANPDVHNMAGMDCVSCHGPIDEGVPAIRHELACESSEYDPLSCLDCHESKERKGFVSGHEKVKESHLKFISCETCHIPVKNRIPAGVVDNTTGKIAMMPKVPGMDIGSEGSWYPEIFFSNKMFYSANSIQVAWWGNMENEDKISPLPSDVISEAYKQIEGKLSDDNNDGIPEANKNEEIKTMLAAIGSFNDISPVYLKGGKIYKLDSAGKLQSEESPISQPLLYNIAHNISPAGEALGAGGCSECHSSESRWVTGRVMQDPFDAEGNPVFVSQGEVHGISPVVMGIHGSYQKNFNWFVILAIFGVMAVALVHYIVIGPKGKEIASLPRKILRYTLTERFVHNVRMVSCILLMVTGAAIALYSHGMLSLFGGYWAVRSIHIALGIIFAISSVAAMIIWFRNCCFTSYDIDWLKVFGGYLTRKETHAPAGRFNAGQKIFYWVSDALSLIIIATGIMLMLRESFTGGNILAIVTVHGISTLILIAAVVAHAYLGSLANPGTIKVLWDGKVSEEWYKTHHPNWNPEEGAKSDRETDSTHQA